MSVLAVMRERDRQMDREIDKQAAQTRQRLDTQSNK